MITQTPSKTLHIALWVVQVLVAATLLWAAGMKLLKPVAAVAAMWPWAGQVPEAVVKGTGIIDLLGALGLLLPGLLRVKPRLTAVAAAGVVLLMICAAVFHVVRGEADKIGFNIVFALLAAFVAWGRFKYYIWLQQP